MSDAATQPLTLRGLITGVTLGLTVIGSVVGATLWITSKLGNIEQELARQGECLSGVKEDVSEIKDTQKDMKNEYRASFNALHENDKDLYVKAAENRTLIKNLGDGKTENVDTAPAVIPTPKYGLEFKKNPGIKIKIPTYPTSVYPQEAQAIFVRNGLWKE